MVTQSPCVGAALDPQVWTIIPNKLSLSLSLSLSGGHGFPQPPKALGFGLWSNDFPGHVATHKAYRRVVAGRPAGGHRGCARLAPTMQAGQGSWIWNCVRVRGERRCCGVLYM